MRRILWAALLLATGSANAWEAVVSEGSRFRVTAPAVVRYGEGARWVLRRFEPGEHECGNAVFGDPAVGVHKRCERPTRPICYPYERGARNLRVRTSPEGIAPFVTSADPAARFVVTWHCPVANGFFGHGFAGYKSDLRPDFLTLAQQLRAGNRAGRDAAFDQYITCKRGTEPACARFAPLAPLVRTQIEASVP